jgi:hypothetical protein
MNDLSVGSVTQVISAVGMNMMKTARFEYDRHINNGADGFRNELTKGNQGAGVYGHIFGIAGAKLFGLSGGIVVAGQMAKDLYDYYRAAPQDRDTNRAELSGNAAGAQVGKHMWNFMSGATPRDPQRLKNSLMKELCK